MRRCVPSGPILQIMPNSGPKTNEMRMRRPVVVTALLVTVMAGVDCRAESEVAPNEQLPTVHCFGVSGVHETPKAQCELVNDTSVEFVFDSDSNALPNYSIEQRQAGYWKLVTAQHKPEHLTKHRIAAGAIIMFSADLPKASEPIRVRLVVYRSAGTSPIPVFGNAVRLPGSTNAGRDDDVPMLPCSEVSPPKLIHRIKPDYPKTAQIARIEGTVVLEAVIDKNGSVQDARIVKSIPVLDLAAVSAVKRWKYTPAQDRRGHPVAVYFRVFVKFELGSAASLPARKSPNSSIARVAAVTERAKTSPVSPAA